MKAKTKVRKSDLDKTTNDMPTGVPMWRLGLDGSIYIQVGEIGEGGCRFYSVGQVDLRAMLKKAIASARNDPEQRYYLKTLRSRLVRQIAEATRSGNGDHNG